MSRLNRNLFFALCFSFIVSVSVAAEPLSGGKSSSVANRLEMPDTGMGEAVAAGGSSVEYTRASFDSLVELMNCVAPYMENVVEGMSLSGVKMEGDNININYTCTRLIAYAISLAGNDEEKLMKEESAKAIYALLNGMGNDDLGVNMVDEMVSLGLKVNYNFYLNDSEELFKTITISAMEIKDAGKVKENLYSV